MPTGLVLTNGAVATLAAGWAPEKTTTSVVTTWRALAECRAALEATVV